MTPSDAEGVRGRQSRKWVVPVEVDFITLEGDRVDRRGRSVEIPSVNVTCTLCGEESESYGQSIRSVRRSICELREACGCGNYLVTDGPEDEPWEVASPGEKCFIRSCYRVAVEDWRGIRLCPVCFGRYGLH